jgi:hypothetical protein
VNVLKKLLTLLLLCGLAQTQAQTPPGVKVPGLPPAAPFTGVELIPVQQGNTGPYGGTVAASPGQLLFYNETPAETAAGIVFGLTPGNIVNPHYQPGHVDRYFTNATPATTSATAAFQAAINQARDGGVDVVWGETGEYLLDNVLDATFTGSANQSGITFRQIGHPSSDAPGGLLEKQNGYAAFDLTGCDGCTFYDLTMTTDATTYPKIAFLEARNSSGGSLFYRFYNTKVGGKFSKAILWNYGAEDDIYVGNYWLNYAADTGTKAVVITANNYFNGAPSGITSAYTAIATGSQSTIDHQFFGGQYGLVYASSTSDVFYLDAVENLKIYAPWIIDVGSAANGRAYVYVDMVNNPSNFVHLNSVQSERGPYSANYGVLFSHTSGSGPTATNTGWGLNDVYWDVGAFSIAAADATPIVDSLHVTSLQESGSNRTISNVAITGTAGQFSCTCTNFLVGQSLTLAGAYGGTGSIIGYTSPKTYYVSATNGTSIFTLQSAPGTPIVTTAGTPTGITYIPAPGGFNIPLTLQTSTVDYPGYIWLGTDLRSVITGCVANQSITTHTADVIIDICTGSITAAGTITP